MFFPPFVADDSNVDPKKHYISCVGCVGEVYILFRKHACSFNEGCSWSSNNVRNARWAHGNSKDNILIYITKPILFLSFLSIQNHDSRYAKTKQSQNPQTKVGSQHPKLRKLHSKQELQIWTSWCCKQLTIEQLLVSIWKDGQRFHKQPRAVNRLALGYNFFPQLAAVWARLAHVCGSDTARRAMWKRKFGPSLQNPCNFKTYNI